MALRITDECTACGLCLPECPTRSITEGDIYSIDPSTCTECEGEADGPRCAAICPIEICIVRS